MFERVRIYLSPVRETNDIQHRFEATIGEMAEGLSAYQNRISELEGQLSRLSAIRARATEGLSAFERVLARARGAHDAPLAR